MSAKFQKRGRPDSASKGDQARGPRQQNFRGKRQHPYSRPGQRNPERRDAEEEAQVSINALKTKIRDITRLLTRADNDPNNKMPQGIRIERERELESCKHELEEKQVVKKEAAFRNKIIGKYHHIRFFERQRASRILKRLTKELASLEDEAEKAEKLRSIHNADVDVNYTIYYPLLRPYVSLFPKQDGQGKEPGRGDYPEGPKGDADMWRTVEKAMEERTLEALRESREGVVMPSVPQNSQTQKTKKDNKKDTKEKGSKAGTSSTAQNDEDEEDDDDGFFFTDTAGDPSMDHVR